MVLCDLLEICIMATLILLRGLIREHGHWGDFPALLQRAFPGYNVLTPDIAGNGDRNLEKSPLSIRAMMLDVRSQLTQSGARAPYHLIALSMGGMIAMDWAHCFPQELGPSVLINSSARNLNPVWDRLRPANYPGVLAMACGLMHSRARERWIFRQTCRHADPRLIDDWCEIAVRRPVSNMNALRQLIAAARFHPSTPSRHLQLNCIASAGDQLVNPRCSMRMASNWHLPIYLHPSAGHDLPSDDPTWLIQTLQTIISTPCITLPCS